MSLWIHSSVTAVLSALYRFTKSSVNFRGQANVSDTYVGNEHSTDIQELYFTRSDSDHLTFDIGKRVIKWGKGYAWNPVGFVERPKDPNDPALSREGFVLATADYVRSFDGALKTIAFTPVILPVTEEINQDYSNIEDINYAAKLYLLYRDTDIDIMLLGSGSRTARFGADFSSNVTANFELHGEFAYINNSPRAYINAANQLLIENSDSASGLLGQRYLAETDVTWIVEY